MSARLTYPKNVNVEYWRRFPLYHQSFHRRHRGVAPMIRTEPGLWRIWSKCVLAAREEHVRRDLSAERRWGVSKDSVIWKRCAYV